MWWGTLSLFLVYFLLEVRSETLLHKMKGSNVTLSPAKTSGPVKSILWKQGDNLAMEYYGGPDDPFAYEEFKKRGSLNTADGEMTITGLTSSDSGLYTVEINNEVNKQIRLMVIAAVVKPNISTSCHGDSCVLTCEGKTVEAEPVSYIWIFDKKHTQTKTKERKLTKGDHVKYIQCELENPVSSFQSNPLRNPFIPDEKPSIWTEVIIGVVVGVLLLIGSVFAVLHIKGIYKIPFDRMRPTRTTAPAVTYVGVRQHDDDAVPPKGPESVKVEQPGPSDDPTQRPNGTEAAPGKHDDAVPLNGPESVKVEQPGPSDDPTQRLNGTEAAPGKHDDAAPLKGPESVTVEQPGPSDDPTQRPNGTEVEVSADVHPNTYKDIGPAPEDQAASGHDSGEAPTSPDNHGTADADKPDDGESVPDKKPQEDEHKDTKG